MADLWLPAGVVDPPVVVSIHGGYFMAPYRRDLHAPIGPRAVRRGFAVWNVEYRRVGTGGGPAETTDDVWAAVDALPLPPGRRVAVFGHSAGGYLAEWLAAHPRVDLVVPLAGALDLAGVVRAGWDGGAVTDWLGAGPDEDPARYAAAVLAAGDRTDLVELDGEGHYAFLDPRQPAFETLYAALDRWRSGT
ncbi:MAG: hypothetical protein JWP62_2895 [Blastococcus sp.]|nr:hypothetical protein [Blastococcus sp.]